LETPLNLGSDEIGDVARAFNEMAGEVERVLEEQRAFAAMPLTNCVRR
jgi:HAMP domain-containing protein